MRVVGPVDGRGQTHRERRRRLGLDREVGHDVLHERACRPGAHRTPSGGRRATSLGQGVPHQRRRAEDAVEPGRGHHLDDGAHAASLVAEPLGQGPVELELAGGVGPVAELVLEPHHVDPVASAVGQHPRHHEAGQGGSSGRGLRQHQEQVVHGRRGEPLVPVQGCTGRPRPSARLGSGWRRTSEPPCFSVMPMPASGARLRRRCAHARVVGPRGQQRRPLPGDRVVGAQRRHSGVGHRDRATVTRLGLRPREEPGRPTQVGVGVAGPAAPTAPPAARGRPRAPSASARTGGTATSSIRLPHRSYVVSSG